MDEQYENLTACCGGKITLEGLKRFEQAIPEFRKFVELGAQMCAPRRTERPTS
jgi:hypothetical protein